MQPKLAHKIQIMLVSSHRLDRCAGPHRTLRIHRWAELGDGTAVGVEPFADGLVAVHCLLVSRGTELNLFANTPQEVVHLRVWVVGEPQSWCCHDLDSSKQIR